MFSMETLVLKVDETEEGKKSLLKAASVIREGGLVAFPTETVYGLGGDALNPTSSKRIYAAKGRPSDNPLIVHIANVEQVNEIARDVPQELFELAEAFWPGPLTIVLKKADKVPTETTGGLDTVAIRMPSNKIARDLIIESNCMIAAPSANVSGKPSPTLAEHVYKDLTGRIDAIIDGGQAIIGLESTIVDLTSEEPTILRPGAVTKDMLETVLGKVEIDPGILDNNSGVKPKAPGMRYKHYAPDANLIVVEGTTDNVINFINKEIDIQSKEGKSCGVLATADNESRYIADYIKSIGNADDEDEIAKNLYSVLREFDETNVDIIYSESFDNSGIGQATMNRLLRAAGNEVVDADIRTMTRVIFVGKSGSARSPMAAAILKGMKTNREIEVLSRGMLVHFPEPLNPKVEAVLTSNGVEVGEFTTKQLEEEDITSTTIILTMEEAHRKKIIDKYENANESNTFVLSKYVGDELEIINPYGGTLQTYGLCFEVLNETLVKLADKFNNQ